jgi:ribose transport system permease protein
MSATTYSKEAATTTPRTVWQAFLRLQARIPLIQLIALVGIFVYGAATLPGLSSWSSVKEILVLSALVGLASTGQTLLILMGGFDLSISGFIVASALVTTTLKDKYNLPFGVALLIAVVVGGFLGGLAGNICHRFKIQPLIVTLAMGAIAVGLVQAQTGGLLAGSAPNWLQALTRPTSHTFGIDIPPVVAIWAVVAVLMAAFLHRTVPGRRLFATGANPRAAEYSLVNTRRVWTLAFAFSAIASVFVGLLVGGFAGSVDSTIGDPYLFQSVVAVIVGGTVFGGPGDYTRTVIGALFISLLTIVVVGHGAGQADQQIIYGATILLAVTLYGRERRLRDRI